MFAASLLTLLLSLAAGQSFAQEQEALPEPQHPNNAEKNIEADIETAPPREPDSYQASEQISEDLSVSFPVDI